MGASQRLSAVRWGVAGRVVWAWVFTIPGAAIVAAAAYGILQAVLMDRRALFFLGAGIVCAVLIAADARATSGGSPIVLAVVYLVLAARVGARQWSRRRRPLASR